MAHIRQSTPDLALKFQLKAHKIFEVISSSVSARNLFACGGAVPIQPPLFLVREERRRGLHPMGLGAPIALFSVRGVTPYIPIFSYGRWLERRYTPVR